MKYLRSILFVVYIAIVAFPDPSFSSDCISLYDIEPLAEDIYFLELINRARANPEDEAQLYNIDLNEGVSTSSTISTTPKQPLAFNINLYKAALVHSEDMIAQDYFSHYTYMTNASPKDRTDSQGYYYYSGENIAINMSTALLDITQQTAEYHHELLFVDEDIANRGHRVNMLNSSHAEAGVAFAHGEYEQFPNAVASTSDFGRGETSAYICGVIYDDKNQNSFYDVGEGIPHAKLTIVETGQSVDAFSAGAYSLGMASSGTFTVEAYLCKYNAYATKTVYIGSDNVKLDFLLSDFFIDTSCKSLSISEIIIPDTPEELAKSPVTVSSGVNPLASMETSLLNMAISLPCYTEPVDIYIVVFSSFPDGPVYFLSDSGKLTSSRLQPLVTNNTELYNMAIRFNMPKGEYGIFWIVVPANGGNLLSVNWGGYAELGFLMHHVE